MALPQGTLAPARSAGECNALDWWVRAAFFGSFLALGICRFEGESTLPPQAGTLYRVLRKRKPLGSDQVL